MNHIVIELNGVGMSGKAKAVREKDRLRNSRYTPGWSYEVALARGQNEVYRALLTELGFECKITSTNPNSGNRIKGWFKECPLES